MKYFLIFLLLIVLGTLGYGFYLKNLGNSNGEITIGIGVLVTAFILMPLFIYHRYKNKDLKSFELKNWVEKVKEQEKKDNK